MTLQTTSNLTLSIKASRPAHREEAVGANPAAAASIDTARWFQLMNSFHCKDPELDTACWAETLSKDLRTIAAGGAVNQRMFVADLADAVSVLRELSSALPNSK